MDSFLYGSRVFESERQVRTERNSLKIGNALHAVVNFLVTFLVFVLINLLLNSLVQHTHLTVVKVLHFVQSNVELLLAEWDLTDIYLAFQQSFCMILAIAFTCVYGFHLAQKRYGAVGCCCEEHETYSKDITPLHTDTVYRSISYRHKVCFLS